MLIETVSVASAVTTQTARLPTFVGLTAHVAPKINAQAFNASRVNNAMETLGSANARFPVRKVAAATQRPTHANPTKVATSVILPAKAASNVVMYWVKRSVSPNARAREEHNAKWTQTARKVKCAAT